MLTFKRDYFKNSFFLSTTTEWNNLDSNIRNSESLAIFNKHILASVRPSAGNGNTFHCHSPDSLKIINRPKLGLSHLQCHKFKHNFQDKLNPICSFVTVETTFLHCSNFSNERLAVFNKLKSTDVNILSKDDFNILKVLLFGDHWFISILTVSIEYIISTKRFDVPFHQNWHFIKVHTLFLYMQCIFRFYKEIAHSFILFSFVFSILF